MAAAGNPGEQAMEMGGGPSNGGMLYHELQEAKLCAIHCVNTLLQGPFFSEIDFAGLAADLDRTERLVMHDSGADGAGDFLSEDSHNVSTGGDFSIQVLQKALEVWDLQIIPHKSPAAEYSKENPDLENAFICHSPGHWFTIRKVNGEWYNFNSLFPAPEHLSKFYLSAFLDTLEGSGCSIFLIRGNFPKDCPISSPNAFGQWLTPEDAEKIMKLCNEQVPAITGPSHPAQLVTPPYPAQQLIDEYVIAQQEEQDMKAALALSMMDYFCFWTGTGTSHFCTGAGPSHSKDSLMDDNAHGPEASGAVGNNLMNSGTVGTETIDEGDRRSEPDSTSETKDDMNQ